jgi:hypothetical protein
MSLLDCYRPDIVEKYPIVRDLIFVSTTDDDPSFDFAHVPNTVDGYVTELERCGQSATEMGTAAVRANPYSTRLMPVSSLNSVLGAAASAGNGGALLESVVFLGYDSTLVGSPHQDADNNTAVAASQASATDAYVASHFRNGIMGNWQPNYCRPEIIVNGESLLSLGSSEIRDSAGASRHLAHLSVGVALPYGVHFYRHFSTVQSIELHAGLAQWIATSASASKLKRYPMVGIMRWRLR